MGTNLNQSKAAAGMTVTKGPIDLAQCDRSLSVVSLLPESTRRYCDASCGRDDERGDYRR